MKQSSEENFQIAGIPAFRDNRLWCVSRGGDALVVDPGDADPVLAHLEARGLHPVALLLTHHHPDHVGGVAALAARYPGIPVFGPVAESITGVSQPLCGGETLALLGAEWRVLAVPGHTRGHLAYCVELADDERRALRVFSGDVLFGLGCGRLFEGSAEQMAASLASIAALPDDTLVYCAHEYTALNLPFAETVLPDNAALRERAAGVRQAAARGQSTLPLRLDEEKASNPFLRCDDPAVIDAAAKRAAARGLSTAALATDRVAVFAILREWRNQF